MKKTNLKVIFAVIILLTISLISCKKEEEANDPNIIEKTYNISITDTTTVLNNSVFKYIDLDANGTNDILINGTYTLINADTTGRFFQMQVTGSGGILSTSQSTNFGSIYIPANLNSSSKINGLTPGFSTSTFPIARAFKGGTLLASWGFTDTAEKLIGFKFLIGSATHFGWLRFAISSDKKTISIKDGAYHKTAGAEITAGAK